MIQKKEVPIPPHPYPTTHLPESVEGELAKESRHGHLEVRKMEWYHLVEWPNHEGSEVLGLAGSNETHR